MSAPFIVMTVGAKTKNPQLAQANTNIFKSISSDKILSLPDMHWHGLLLRPMRFYFKNFFIVKMNTCKKIYLIYLISIQFKNVMYVKTFHRNLTSTKLKVKELH